jgi:hypothetical protein
MVTAEVAKVFAEGRRENLCALCVILCVLCV